MVPERSEHREHFATIPEAVAAIARGEIVVVVDDEDRENEGDLIMAAEKATPETVNMMIRYGSGIVCVPTVEHILRRLGLGPMVASNRESHRTDFTVSVDAAEGKAADFGNVAAIGQHLGAGGHTLVGGDVVAHLQQHRAFQALRQRAEFGQGLDVGAFFQFRNRLLRGGRHQQGRQPNAPAIENRPSASLAVFQRGDERQCPADQRRVRHQGP
mgnify:CR=1 FL=1